MANYSVRIFVDGTNINQVRKQIAAAFPGQMTATEKINLNPSRSERLAEAENLVNDAKTIVEELKDEMEAWHENLPENLQGSSKADEIQESADNLDSLYGELDQVDFSSVEFPSMM